MKIKVIASGSSGNCTYISDGVSALLLDAGLAFSYLKTSLWRNGLSLHRINGVLITHEHQDHAACVKKLIEAGVFGVMSQGTREALRLERYPLIRVLKPLSETRIGTFTIMGFPVEHDAAEPYGFLIQSNHTNEKLLFITDTKYVRYKFQDIDYLLIECNYVDAVLEENMRDGALTYGSRVKESHMSLETVEELVKSLGQHQLKEVHVMHLSDKNSDEAFIKERLMQVSGSPIYIH